MASGTTHPESDKTQGKVKSNANLMSDPRFPNVMYRLQHSQYTPHMSTTGTHSRSHVSQDTLYTHLNPNTLQRALPEPRQMPTNAPNTTQTQPKQQLIHCNDTPAHT